MEEVIIINTTTTPPQSQTSRGRLYEPKSDAPGKLKLLAAMFVMVFCAGGYHIVARIALNIGVSKIVYLIYRNITALLFLGPLAYFFEKKQRPPLSFSILVQFFLLGLIGVTSNQGLYIMGVYYTEPTFASAMQNSIPAFTFVMVSLLRLEEVHFMRRDGMAKILGAIASVGGATIITLYKGPPILRGGINFSTDITTSPEKMLDRTWGCVCFIAQCLSYSGWMVLQVPVVKNYPAKLSVTSFTCFFGLIQLLTIAGFTERDPKYWRIESLEEVFVILYAGIVNSGIVYYLSTWSIQKAGAVFTATFHPAETILVAAMAYVLLGDQLYLGGILGGILIVAGLYLVLWGKTEEENIAKQDNTEETTLKKNLLDHREECPVTVHIP